MAALDNARHEHFAQLVAKGSSASKAYIGAGYSRRGAAQSAARLLTNAQICSRVQELQSTISAGLTEASIRDVNARISAYQLRRDKLSAALDFVMQQRGVDMADLPGGASGIMTRDYKGLQAGKVVTKIDPGVIAIAEHLLSIEQQAARELGQWMDKSEMTVKEGDLAARLARGRERLAKAKV